MIAYTIIATLLTLIYVFIFILYLSGWLRLPEFIGTKFPGSTKVSIIIPARNEEKNIAQLINDLLGQSYNPADYEIIVVDDFSDDSTATIVSGFSSPAIHLLHAKDAVSASSTSRSFKKSALEYGIEKATGELIITTDADCRVGREWIKTIVNFYESRDCHMIVAPVLFLDEGNVFDRMQSLDFIGLIGITGATLYLNFPTMCNGANLAFRKDSYHEVKGYKGIDQVSSGDDLLLMYKIAKRWKNGVLFLKNRDAVVFTFPQKTLSNFMKQRIRWTSKSKYYPNKMVILNLVLVYLFNISILITFVLSIVNTEYLYLFALQVILKIILEFSFLTAVTRFFNRQKLLSLFLPAQLIHIFYIVITGFVGNFLKPNWKGRKIS